MVKKTNGIDGSESISNKPRATSPTTYNKVSTLEAADRTDKNTPFDELDALMGKQKSVNEVGKCAIWWLRMEDMRIEDNKALHLASEFAVKHNIPLVAIHIISPGDFEAHDRGGRSIDFRLRNLKVIKNLLADLNIPLLIHSHPKRKQIPSWILSKAEEFDATHIFANIEYPVDELRRDCQVLKLGEGKGVETRFCHDKLVVPPGRVKSKTGTNYTVYSPWQRSWAVHIADNPELLELFPPPKPNAKSVKTDASFKGIFNSPVPNYVEGFKCDDLKKMEELFPAGTETAKKMLDLFISTKSRTSQVGDSSPTAPGAEKSSSNSRVHMYTKDRDHANIDSTSRLSPYLAAGVISARMCLAAVKPLGKGGKLESGRDTGVGMWVQEIAWRDFYACILVHFPRVSMGHPYLKKFRDLQWEYNPDHLQAWKEGKTGFPIVDAAMRQMNSQGWMHNRCRMITASFLTKDLMLDWREGERYMMQSYIDGDLAANNGGWQWCASTGTDPQPYFRIFNPASQSEKADPTGDYIRHFVPELKNLKGKSIHDPFSALSSAEFEKLGYPKPIVDHKASRDRALARYKNPGEKPDLDGVDAVKAENAEVEAGLKKSPTKRKEIKIEKGQKGLEESGFTRRPAKRVKKEE